MIDHWQNATPPNERRFGKETTARRRWLAEVERELVGLRDRYEVAMSLFQFEVAIALDPAIAPLEQEQQALAAATPEVRIETASLRLARCCRALTRNPVKIAAAASEEV